MKITARGVPELSDSLDAVDLDSVAKATATGILVRARGFAPVRTGRLRRSIHLDGSGQHRAVVADAPYAAYVHYGSSHNPVPVPFFDLASSDRDLAADVAAEVERELREAGLT